MHPHSVLVIGAGAAGSAAAAALQQADPPFDVTVIGKEASAPYNRTTVNKGLLSGAVDESAIALPGMADGGIRWRTGRKAVAMNPRQRSIQLEDGAVLSGDAIILATGASPRSLPAPAPQVRNERVVFLQTKSDALRLRALLAGKASTVLVVGAGLLGSETAGVLSAGGHRVTLASRGPLPLLGHVGRTVAQWAAQAHQQAGVDLLTNTRVTGLRTDAGRLQVEISGHENVQADVVVVSVGAEPETAWLATSGVPMERGGVLVDAGQRVLGHRGIFAAGDIAAVQSPGGGFVRVQHWGAAVEQGRAAARSLIAARGCSPADGTAAAPRVPAYSTYVQGTKVSIIGDARHAQTEQLILGAPGDPRFAVALLDASQRVVAGVGVGGARAVNQLKPLIERRAHLQELAASS